MCSNSAICPLLRHRVWRPLSAASDVCDDAGPFAPQATGCWVGFPVRSGRSGLPWCERHPPMVMGERNREWPALQQQTDPRGTPRTDCPATSPWLTECGNALRMETGGRAGENVGSAGDDPHVGPPLRPCIRVRCALRRGDHGASTMTTAACAPTSKVSWTSPGKAPRSSGAPGKTRVACRVPGPS